MRFYVGLHHPCDAGRFERCMVSVNVLAKRKGYFPAREWMLDSGAFSNILKHGRHLLSVDEYAAQISRWWRNGYLAAAVCQDWMCEPVILEKTGLTVTEHQRRTTESWLLLKDRIRGLVYIMPVIQGYWPDEYVDHLRRYGRDFVKEGSWVGVGSVCKRNARVEDLERVLVAIKRERPDLKLHGFGVKTTALASAIVRDCLWSADSMAWSAAARWEGRDRNSPHEAERFVDRIREQKVESRELQLRMW